MALVSVAVPFADNWYFDEVLRGVRTALADHGHEADVWVEPPGPAARDTVTARIDEQLADPRYIGAIPMHVLLQGERADRVRRHGKPVVLIGGRSDDLPVVRLDDEQVARLATQHLIDLGHRSIANLAGYAAAPDDFTIRADRVRGYSEAMTDGGLEMLATVRPSEFRLDAARRQARELLRGEDRPTAIFAIVDELAFGVLEAAEELGLAVPGDLSVIGIDDHADAARRGLTTVRQDPAAAGRAAADRLLGRTDVHDQVMPVELVVRATTAPLQPARRPGLLGRLLGRR